jgi:hypothetical protein
MSNMMKKRVLLVGLTCLFLIGMASGIPKAATDQRNADSYIEIVANRITYVPRTAQYVKVNGQVRRIVKFATELTKAEEDCKCPNCCKGSCYIIVFTDGILLNKPIVMLGFIWVECT